MKKFLTILFSILFLSSACFAEVPPAGAPDNQAKAAGEKTQGVSKKPVKPRAKKSGKQVQKMNKSKKNKKKETAS